HSSSPRYLTFSFFSSRHRLALPSFPTRRSSDLWPGCCRHSFAATARSLQAKGNSHHWRTSEEKGRQSGSQSRNVISPLRPRKLRSEEHTSELQSPCNLVCRLLLEKKK